MTKKNSKNLSVDLFFSQLALPLVQVHLVRARSVLHFADWPAALAALRPSVALSQAVQIFESSFHI
jgi:hypothetical protein